jgi:hypothetical protein
MLIVLCYVNDNVYCVAACVRNNQGQFIRAYSKRFDGTPNIAEAEAMRMKKPCVGWKKLTCSTTRYNAI